MKELSRMTLFEVQEYLAKLKEELAEVEEERLFVLRQTGLHVSAGTVNRYENEVSTLKAQIEEAEQALHARRAEAAQTVASR